MPTARKKNAPVREPGPIPRGRPVAVPSGRDTGVSGVGRPSAGIGAGIGDALRQSARSEREPRNVDVEDPGDRLSGDAARTIDPVLDLADRLAAASDRTGEARLRKTAGRPQFGEALPRVDDPLLGGGAVGFGDSVGEHVENTKRALADGASGFLDKVAAAEARGRRKALGMSQKALAERIGITDPRVVQLEQGQPWKLQNVEAFAAALGCDPIELLGGDRLSDAERAVVQAMRAGDHGALMEAAVAAMKKR